MEGADIGVDAGGGAKLKHGGSGYPQRHVLFAKTVALNRSMLTPRGNSPHSLLNDRLGYHNSEAFANDNGTLPYILLWCKSNLDIGSGNSTLLRSNSKWLLAKTIISVGFKEPNKKEASPQSLLFPTLSS